jgi:AraC family transcriptional regulator
MRAIADGDDHDVSLAALSRRIRWSQSRLHRGFTRLAGETPRRFAERIRLERAAVDLTTTEASVLQISLAYGFSSHEVFSRAFRRRFDRSPQEHRRAARTRDDGAFVDPRIMRSIGPCLGVFGLSLAHPQERSRMAFSEIERRMVDERPVLFIRRRIASTALQQTMSECFGALYQHGHSAGLGIAGHPAARYVVTGPGLSTVDFVMPLTAPASGAGEMQAGVLPAGPVAFTVHQGPYDDLPATNAAVEAWIEAKGFAVGGAPWEWYVTSPGETPDPADWRTEVYWPLAG